MSYILDALRKSEQERQRGTPQGLEAVYASASSRPGSKSGWQWLLGIALLLNAGLMMWWFEPWKGKQPGTETIPAHSVRSSQTKAVLPAPETNNPIQGGDTRPAMASGQADQTLRGSSASVQIPETARLEEVTRQGATSDRRGDERSPSMSGRPMPSSAPSPVVSSPQARRVEPPRTEGSTPGDSQPPAPGPKSSDPGKGMDSRRSTAKTGSTTASKAPQAAGSGHPSAVAGPKDSGLLEDLKPLISETRPSRKEPDYRHVPASLKEAIPKITLSFLVYSERPAERKVTINGKVLREGDQVSDGLKLESITQEGAILSYKGFRFHKGVF